MGKCLKTKSTLFRYNDKLYKRLDYINGEPVYCKEYKDYFVYTSIDDLLGVDEYYNKIVLRKEKLKRVF